MTAAQWKKLARWRVPLGFATFLAAFLLSSPTTATYVAGLLIALTGQALRVWAAGHIEKSREVTRSGPYRHIRHPLYVGSVLMGTGFVVASASVWTAVLAVAYFTVTYVAAVRSEEATLDEKFDGEYSAYREGRATDASAPATRRFSLDRAFKMNREGRSLTGFVVAFALLAFWTF